MDTSHNRVSVTADNSLGRDNLFSKAVVLNLYESYHLQSSVSSEQRVYDSQYRSGFPKLYCFDTSVGGRSKISDKSNKFSFKTQRQQFMMTNYSVIMQENRQLRHQLQFMGSQNRRILGILQGKETQWHRLNSQIEYLKRNPRTVPSFQHNGCIWEMKYTEIQTKLNELNSMIENNSFTVTGLRQQIVQLQSRQTSLRSQISQMHSELNLSLRNASKLQQELFQATSKVKQFERMSSGKPVASSQTQQQTQVLVYEQKIEQAGRQIDGYKVRVRQYERQIALYEEKIKEYQSKIFNLEENSNQPSEIKQRDGHMVERVRELEQRERQHIQKTAELHKYLKKAQSYIEQLHSQLQSLSQQKPQNNQPQPIIFNLTQQLSKLNQRISQLEQQKRLTQDQTGQLERLNMKIKELRDYLTKAQNYIEQLQEILRQHQEVKGETVVEYRVTGDVLERIRRVEVVQREWERFQKEKEEFVRGKCQIEELIERLRVDNEMLKRQNEVLREQRQQMEKRIAGTERIQELLVLKQTLVEQNARIKREMAERESQESYRLTQEINRLNGETAQLRNQVTILQQENITLAELNRKLQTQISQQVNNIAQRPQSTIQKTPQISQSEIQSQLAKLRLQSVILLQQINRLNNSLNQVTQFLLNAQSYITQVQTRLQQVSNAHFESVTTQARLRLQSMILLQEINRLNQVIRESHQHLVDAENYIEQCELQIRSYGSQQARIVYKVPSEVQQKIALLAVENQRISEIVRQYRETGGRQGESIREVQAKELTQMRGQLHQAQDSKIILRKQLQNALHKTQYYEKLYTSLKQQQSVNSYEQQCQQLREHLITAQNHIQHLQKYVSQLQAKINQGQDHTQEQKYQKQIMELNQRIIQMQSFNQVQINIYQEQVGQYNLQIVQLSQNITSLTQQVNNYRTQITTLKTQNNSIRSQFSTLQSQIQGYIQQISKQNLQLSHYQQQINSLEHQASQPGHPQNLQSELLQSQLAQQHLKSIILLQQINRLNYKLNQLQTKNKQLVSHLVTAEDHITRIEYQLQEQLRQKTVHRQGQTMVQSAEVSKQLTAQLSRLEYSSKVQISARDLRIVFLLQQINRLNHKERQLMSIIDLGGSQTSKFLSANHQIAILRQEKLKYQAQLAAVLQHLKYAEDYITQLLHQNQNFVHERQLLITQLSNIYPRK